MPGAPGGGNRWNEEKQNATRRDGARSITTLISKRQTSKQTILAFKKVPLKSRALAFISWTFYPT